MSTTTDTAPGAPANTTTADTGGTGSGGNSSTDAGTSAGGTASGSATGTGSGSDAGAGGTAGGNAGASAGSSAGGNAGTGTADPGDGDGSFDTGSEEFRQLPAWAQKRIRGLEKESGDYRIKAKTAKETADARAKEAADKLQGFIDGFARVIGLTADDEQTAPPKNLDEAMKRLETTQQQLASTADRHRELEVRLAVWEQAATHGANTRELMDSASFLAKIGRLDPRGDGFTDTLAELIKTHIDSNPTRFKAAPPAAPPAQSGGEFTGGPGGRPSDAELSVEQHLARINNLTR